MNSLKQALPPPTERTHAVSISKEHPERLT